MVKKIVLLSGHVSAGKTSLARRLQERFGVVVFNTGEHLKSLKPEVPASREAMQKLGEKLDRTTGGTWVSDGLMCMLMRRDGDEDPVVVVDAVRIKKQIAAVRKAYRDKVIHVHLDAPVPELAKRYAGKKHDDLKELPSYERVLANPTEAAVDELAEIADVLIDTKRCTHEDVMVKVASHLGLYGRESVRLVDILVGGQYGSEGKGNIVAYLAKEYDILLRVGGPNAGHKVYAEPIPLNFHHLPSGCLAAAGSRLIIGPGATVHVPSLLDEIGNYQIDVERLIIDPKAMIISEADRKREGKVKQAIGSTGKGVGVANARRILEREKGGAKLAKEVRELKPFLRDSCQVLEQAFEKGQKILLEGTQGTGLSLYHGTYPYVTSRDTTVSGCLAEAGISPSRVRKIVMVCRTYPIRVESPQDGSSGPMSREVDWGEIARRSGYSREALEQHEVTSTTARRRRVGEFEWTLLSSTFAVLGC
jgi:adenylosuccinate synthase